MSQATIFAGYGKDLQADPMHIKPYLGQARVT